MMAFCRLYDLINRIYNLINDSFEMSCRHFLHGSCRSVQQWQFFSHSTKINSKEQSCGFNYPMFEKYLAIFFGCNFICERNFSLALRNMGVVESRMPRKLCGPKRQEVTRGWMTSLKMSLINCRPTVKPSIVKAIIPKRVKWTGY